MAWPSVELGSLYAAPTRNGLNRPKAMRGAGVPMVNMGELFAHDRIGDIVMDRVPLAEPELSKYVLEPGDLLFARQSLVLHGAGKCSIFEGASEPVTFESHITRVRLDKTAVEPRFYYYFFKAQLGRAVIERIVEQGAGAAGIRGSDLAGLKVPCPPIDEQRRIAHILGTLDDKIELNRRMNETLEEMARALFKSWFVDFEPVRAKAERRDPGLPKDLADLFPDRLVDSELGPIPEGWEVGTVGEIANVVDCLHSKKPERQVDGRPMLQLSNVRDDGLMDLTDIYPIADDDYVRWTSRLEAMEGDCVITNVGRVGAVAQVPPHLKAALGRNMTGVRATTNFPFPTFLVEALRSQAMRAEIERLTDTGTILNALNVRSIPLLRFAQPPLPVATAFERIARPLRGRMEECAMESATVANTRDLLLSSLLGSTHSARRDTQETMEAAR